MIVLCTVGLYISIWNQAWQLDGLEVKLMIDSRTFVVGAVRGGRYGCESRNHVDYEAMCGLMSCNLKCTNVLCVNSSPPQYAMWQIHSKS